MSAPLFDSYLIVDWSARSKPSPARPSPDAIWWTLARRTGATVTTAQPAYARTRAEAVERLITLLAHEADAGRRVLAGFDFPFGWPTGVASRVTGHASALALWDWLSDAVEDHPDNANNRFEVASRINRTHDGTGPFWGRPAAWDYPDIPTRGRDRNGSDHPPERRHADTHAKGAKTVWQLAYSGSVGSQAILGLPALNRMRNDPRLCGHVAVWPFQTGLAAPASDRPVRGPGGAGRAGGRDARIVDRPVWLVEIYPSLIRHAVQAERRKAEILDAAQTRVNAIVFARLDAKGALAPLFEGPTDLTDNQREAIVSEEATILGLGHEDALNRAAHGANMRCAACPAPTDTVTGPAPLRYERDPAAIYAQSFATVRAETRLEHLPADLHDVAIRLVHSCGMTDVPDRLAWSADLATSARRALANGAPILCDCEMVASGIVRARLPAGNPVICTLNDPSVPELAQTIGNTRSASAVELWASHLEGAVVVIGNAPTALFHLLELIDRGAPRPAAILGFPVGFVGAAESKAELAANPRGLPFLTLRGRRGGSAMAAAALNALAAGLAQPR